MEFLRCSPKLLVISQAEKNVHIEMLEICLATMAMDNPTFCLCNPGEVIESTLCHAFSDDTGGGSCCNMLQLTEEHLVYNETNGGLLIFGGKITAKTNRRVETLSRSRLKLTESMRNMSLTEGFGCAK